MNKALILRNAALKLEKTDMNLSLSLMKMALELRPSGPLIQSKIKYYEKKLAESKLSLNSLKKKVKNGNLAVIPIGFRCYTKLSLKNDYGIKQASLPFDSGFFTPHSVASILRSGKINLRYCEENNNHSVCIKRRVCEMK